MFSGLWMFLVAAGVVMAGMLVWADNEGSHVPAPEAAPPNPRRAPVTTNLSRTAQPVKVRRGSPDAPVTRTFAFEVDRGGMVLAGPAELTVDDIVYLEPDRPQGSEVVSAAARVVAETTHGHKAVRFSA